MERINTSMDNQGSNNNYNNGNSNGGNNGDGGKGNHNGQILMAFILISLIALFIMSLVTNQFNQMSTQEVSYSEFLDMVNGTGKWEGRSVKSVEIGSYQIDITLNSDEKTPYEVTYYCGRVADDELIPLLKEKGVDISGVIPDNTSTWIYSILSYLIPLVLIWVVLGVVMRRMGGGATLACAAAGATVCHVDASKGIVAWGKDNAAASGLADRPIRWLVDDCAKFVAREKRRGNTYDGIIMDPPSYGRGPGGEIWKLEDCIYDLISQCEEVLSDQPLFFAVNSYTTGLSPAVMEYMLKTTLVPRFGGQTSCDEIGLPVSATGGVVPCGATAIWEE